MLKSFLSKVGIGGLEVDTVVDNQVLEEGETLNGTVYIDGGEADQIIDHITLEVFVRIHREDAMSDFEEVDRTITKHSIELIGDSKSKKTRMIPFEIVPDDRWLINRDNEKLMLKTTVHINNAVDAYDEDEIQYA
ncbi:sporulation protein [Bhargavaea beijingensis]|uniref:Sporulation-control protein n=1 Tax=Bhargavaea beijingensis TaxID=426756 RepID=A0A1G7DFD4_9BACL|nr:sporulation protein [Bhargavaea beijingensis]RSK30926.1 stage 0 sporulation protein M [Bhargavaea beijingensis]SDE50159.1 sporulation-control protein [Bhargavaea beijingensis]